MPCRTAFHHGLLVLVALGVATARGQLIQGSDSEGQPFHDPDNWTSVILDPDLDKTVEFLLNPCEVALYWDGDGAPRTCKPRPACAKLEDMEVKLDAALAVWAGLATDALTLTYGGLVAECPETAGGCPEADGWTDDGDWVVTRTYVTGLPAILPAQECPEAASPATRAGAGLRFYEDDAGDTTTRWVRECDIVFNEQAWDVTPDHSCIQSGLYTNQQCQAASTMGLAHEIGHCIGFGHSYLTRRSLEPLESTLAGLNLELQEALPSIMSYDHPGTIDVAAGGLNLYDEALYLYSYAAEPDPFDDDDFAAYGTISDCGSPAELLYGAAVIALDATATTVRPVHISMSGVHPLGPGEFRLEHLDRDRSYRLMVVDARDANQIKINGWDFDESEGPVPGLPVFRTDDWDEDHAGDDYKYETSAQFATGFDFELTAKFDDIADEDYDAGPICVDF